MIKQIQNVDKAFTEIFYLLTSENNFLSRDTLKTIYKHISNAIDLMHSGLQDLMEVISTTKQEVQNPSSLWSFFSLMINLLESLNWFQKNICFTLRQQNILDY